jgi:nicotinate-nucleotide adenylyltransferase
MTLPPTSPDANDFNRTKSDTPNGFTPGKHHITLMGGTFDPIHHAHLIIAEEVRAVLKLDKITFMPAGDPPHKSGRAETARHHRLRMVQLAIASNPHFIISLIEVEQPGPSYLVNTLRLLRQEWGKEPELSFIIGGDSLEQFSSWYDPVGILAQLNHLIVVRRPGYVEDIEYNKQLEEQLPGITQRLLTVKVPQMDISSTDLRRRVREALPIKYQVPEAVEAYIKQHGLYSAKRAAIED